MRRIETPDETDLALLRELLAESERFDGAPPVSDQTLLAVSQGKRSIFEFEQACGILGEGELDLVVRPAYRGRGIGGEALAQMLAAHAAAGGGEIKVWAHGQNPAATALLEHAGFEAVRELLRMTLDPQLLPGAISKAKELPAGFAVRAFEGSAGNLVSDAASDIEEDADAWVRVNALAFAAHPEQGSVSRTDFDGLTREAWFDPADLLLAFELDGERAEHRLAGSTWVKTTREDGVTETELYAIGVDPAYAGKGLGAALLGETMRRMAAHDPHRITLYVDGDNLGARALYERAGFEVEQRSAQFRIANTR